MKCQIKVGVKQCDNRAAVDGIPSQIPTVLPLTNMSNGSGDSFIRNTLHDLDLGVINRWT